MVQEINIEILSNLRAELLGSILFYSDDNDKLIKLHSKYQLNDMRLVIVYQRLTTIDNLYYRKIACLKHFDQSKFITTYNFDDIIQNAVEICENNSKNCNIM